MKEEIPTIKIKDAKPGLESAFADNERMKAEHPAKKLYYEDLKKFKKYLIETEENLKIEFPEIDINDSNPINFLDNAKLYKEKYEELKRDQEGLKKDIEKLLMKIDLIENNREN